MMDIITTMNNAGQDIVTVTIIVVKSLVLLAKCSNIQYLK